MFYVATRASYVLVEAANEADARRLGEPALRELHAQTGNRVGRDLPIEIHVVRPAKDDEIELWKWHQERPRSITRNSRHLSMLRPGTKFRLAEMPEVTGTLVKATEARALVRLDRPEEEVEFVDDDGRERRFRSHARRVTSWASTTFVEPIGFEPIPESEHEMSKAKSTKSKKTAAPKAATPKAAAKPKASPKSDGKLSCIDAAAKVLGEKKEPMTTKALIEAMAEKKLWSSPNGQTPAATLYSAILREINAKGKEARFKKADRGLFAGTK